MGASKKTAKKAKKAARKTAKKTGKRLKTAAKKALKSLGGPQKLKQGARKVAVAAADALVDALSPKKKK
jgi:hypothetical protein